MNWRGIIIGNHQISCRSPRRRLYSRSISRRRRLKRHTQHPRFLCLGLLVTLRVTFWDSVCQVLPAPLLAGPYGRLAASRLNLSAGSHLGGCSTRLSSTTAGGRFRFRPFFFVWFSFPDTTSVGCLWWWHLLTSYWFWLKWDLWLHPAYHLLSPSNWGLNTSTLLIPNLYLCLGEMQSFACILWTDNPIWRVWSKTSILWIVFK